MTNVNTRVSHLTCAACNNVGCEYFYSSVVVVVTFRDKCSPEGFQMNPSSLLCFCHNIPSNAGHIYNNMWSWLFVKLQLWKITGMTPLCVFELCWVVSSSFIPLRHFILVELCAATTQSILCLLWYYIAQHQHQIWDVAFVLMFM